MAAAANDPPEPAYPGFREKELTVRTDLDLKAVKITFPEMGETVEILVSIQSTKDLILKLTRALAQLEKHVKGKQP